MFSSMEEAEEFAQSVARLENLEEFVRAPTWREILLEAVEKEAMNPWELDISKLADAYLKRVRDMQAMDLRVPANVILAAALLLHYKAQALRVFEATQVTEEPAFVPLVNEDIPELIYNAEQARTRSVTVDELISAVEEVMKDGRRELPRRIQAEPLSVELPQEAMHDVMEKVYGAAQGLKDEKNIVLFSHLIRQFNGHGESHGQLVSYSLMPLLHLVQDDKIEAWQDRVFGEIFIKVLPQ